MTAMIWYALLIGAVAVERLVEVRVAERNRAVSKTHGGVEFGSGHYPAMVVLHFSLLVGCLVEPIMLHRSFIPALGWPMFAVVLAAQALRWWCITTLDYQWNTRVIVIPGREPRHRRPVSAATPSQLRRGDRRRRGASAGAHRVDYRIGVLGTQRVAAEHTGQESRTRRWRA